ncbi:MAG: hypothetical protein FJ186_00855 [Gammaproteobacteria bacterium]|jgi:murein DD-endopeptidase MepM/ murein hydrolase activator NlpD|nr:hypothetical protein [Gammaproteobacteria bacterium]
MQIAIFTCLFQLFASALFATEALSTTQLKISKTYQAITELDVSIQEEANTITQLKEKMQSLSINMKKSQNDLKESEQHLINLKASSQNALNKLYRLSFADKSTDQIYLTYYSRKVISQQLALTQLKKQQETIINKQADDHRTFNQYMQEHTQLNSQLLKKKTKLESKIAELQSLLDSTLKKANMTQNINRGIFSSILNLKGKLPWPIPGKITQHFDSPLYESQLKAEAILIEPTDHKVLAVHPGKIIYNDWLPAYGYLIIIDHGQNYHTLYGHLDHTTIALNQFVEAGEMIGDINDAQKSNKKIFFSLKYQLTAQDPEQWLSPSS